MGDFMTQLNMPDLQLLGIELVPQLMSTISQWMTGRHVTGRLFSVVTRRRRKPSPGSYIELVQIQL